MNTDRCPVRWCDVGTREHNQHLAVLGQWPGLAAGEHGERTSFVQAVVFGTNPHLPRFGLIVVDSNGGLDERRLELSWAAAAELGSQLFDGHQRYGATQR